MIETGLVLNLLNSQSPNTDDRGVGGLSSLPPVFPYGLPVVNYSCSEGFGYLSFFPSYYLGGAVVVVLLLEVAWYTLAVVALYGEKSSLGL